MHAKGYSGTHTPTEGDQSAKQPTTWSEGRGGYTMGNRLLLLTAALWRTRCCLQLLYAHSNAFLLYTYDAADA